MKAQCVQSTTISAISLMPSWIFSEPAYKESETCDRFAKIIYLLFLPSSGTELAFALLVAATGLDSRASNFPCSPVCCDDGLSKLQFRIAYECIKGKQACRHVQLRNDESPWQHKNNPVK
eukprot:SAG31_NODE_2597_length_5420_cov_16.255403_3_plen_120_part_00